MEISKKEIEELIEKLQNCVNEMEESGIEEIDTKCNTYGLSNFICFGNKGYLSLDESQIEIDY